jgi:glycolate oxidase
MWETRRLTSPALREAHRFKIGEDIVVPRAHIAEMLRRVDGIGARSGLEMATFGHAGDGNLHVNLLGEEDRHDERVAARIEQALGELFRDTLELGGTLSGEHGIGLTKMRYMPWEQSPALLELQKRLKRTLDPQDLLNPGKIFP